MKINTLPLTLGGGIYSSPTVERICFTIESGFALSLGEDDNYPGNDIVDGESDDYGEY